MDISLTVMTASSDRRDKHVAAFQRKKYRSIHLERSIKGQPPPLGRSLECLKFDDELILDGSF